MQIKGGTDWQNHVYILVYWLFVFGSVFIIGIKKSRFYDRPTTEQLITSDCKFWF